MNILMFQLKLVPHLCVLYQTKNVFIINLEFAYLSALQSTPFK